MPPVAEVHSLQCPNGTASPATNHGTCPACIPQNKQLRNCTVSRTTQACQRPPPGPLLNPRPHPTLTPSRCPCPAYPLLQFLESGLHLLRRLLAEGGDADVAQLGVWVGRGKTACTAAATAAAVCGVGGKGRSEAHGGAASPCLQRAQPAPARRLTAAAAKRPLHRAEGDGLALQAHVAWGTATVAGPDGEDHLAALWPLEQVACRAAAPRGQGRRADSAACGRQQASLGAPQSPRVWSVREQRRVHDATSPKTLYRAVSRCCFGSCVDLAAAAASRSASGGGESLTPTCCVQRQRAGGLAVYGQDFIARPDTCALRGAAWRRRNHGQRGARPRL